MRRTWLAIVAAAGITLAAAVPAASAAAASTAVPQVRVNQVGYPSDGPKVAYVMLARPAASVRFEVTTPYGIAYRGTSTDDVGSWNTAYQVVYLLSFSGLNVPGVYQVRVTSPTAAVSPAFVIGTGAQLYRQLVDNAVQYFTSERDGPDVVSSVLGRQPANLTDEQAYVYADPAYDSNDNLLGTLKKIGGPVDVAGGWFDAGGGYEKFAYTASYADALMLIAARDFPGS
jgi:endoglucanase